MKSPTVLLILDDADDIQTYGTALGGLGYRVLISASHAAGLKALESESIDLVIVSQGKEAFEACRVLDRARKLAHRPCVLVITKKMDVHRCLDALDLGAADCLENPDPQDLLWSVATRMRPLD